MKTMRENGVYSLSDKCVHYVMFFLLLLLSVCCLYPFLIILSSSFQSDETIINNGYRVFANEYTLRAYEMTFKTGKSLYDAYVVTIITSVLTVAIGVIVVSTCGYVMSRSDYRYRKVLSFYVF